MEKWLEWLTAGVNTTLFFTAAGCLGIAAIYLWRNYRLEEVILDYQKKAKLQTEQISEKTKDQQTDSCPAMLPMELLALLQGTNMRRLVLEDQKNIQAVSMAVNSSEFSRMIHAMEAEEVFLFINRFLQKAIPIVYEAGGFVEGFRDCGMSALFLDHYEEAVVSAVSICELLNDLEQDMPRYGTFSIGLTYENAVVGAVGDSRRMSLLTLSEEAFGMSEWLMRIAGKYYARILVTDTYAELITDFQRKFNTRVLGYVYIRDTDRMKKIYDVFDGDTRDVRNRKRQTKIVFEKGVSLFLERQYAQARQCFIEVLKMDRMDQAAKEYVFCCEEYIHHGDGKAYIERYG